MTWLTIALIGAIVFDGWAHLRPAHLARVLALREARLVRMSEEVHEMLKVWAETWPDPDIRKKLIGVLTSREPVKPVAGDRRQNYGRRATDRPTVEL